MPNIFTRWISPCFFWNARTLLLLRLLLPVSKWVLGCQKVLRDQRRSSFVVLGLAARMACIPFEFLDLLVSLLFLLFGMVGVIIGTQYIP